MHGFFPLGNNIVRIGVGVGKPESNIDPHTKTQRANGKEIRPNKKIR